MSSSAFNTAAASIYKTCEKIYKKFSALTQEQLNQWVKDAKVDFPVQAGTKTSAEFEIHSFDNGKLKLPKVNAFKRTKTGKVLALKFEKNLAVFFKEDYEVVVEQAIVQMIVFNLRSEFFKAPTKDAEDKNIKGTGSKNITPYGVACKNMFSLLGVECEEKMILNKDEDEGGLERELITKPMTEAQKISLATGQKSKARGGVKKGKSQKTKQLEAVLFATQQKLETLTGYMVHLHENGKLLLNKEDEKVYDNLVQQTTDKSNIKLDCGMAEVEISTMDSTEFKSKESKEELSEEFVREETPILEEEEEERPVLRQPSGAPTQELSEEEMLWDMRDEEAAKEIEKEIAEAQEIQEAMDEHLADKYGVKHAETEKKLCEKYDNECCEENLCSMCRTDKHYKEKNVTDDLFTDTEGEEEEEEETVPMGEELEKTVYTKMYKEFSTKHKGEEVFDFNNWNNDRKDTLKKSGEYAKSTKGEKKQATTDCMFAYCNTMEIWDKLGLLLDEDGTELDIERLVADYRETAESRK